MVSLLICSTTKQAEFHFFQEIFCSFYLLGADPRDSIVWVDTGEDRTLSILYDKIETACLDLGVVPPHSAF